MADARFCFADIETAPMVSAHWHPKTKYVSHFFNRQPTTILCASWKFSHQKKIHHTSISHYHDELNNDTVRQDAPVVEDLVDLITRCADENIIFVAQNGDRFDIPKIRSRIAIHRLPPIPKITTIDTMKEARKLGFDYARLDYLDRVLHGQGKVSTRGWDMWEEIVFDSDHDHRIKVLKEMKRYNDGDIRCLERVFTTLRPYFLTFPNMNLWVGSMLHCPRCGSGEIIYRRKPKMAKNRLYREMSCKSCGHWFHEAGAMRDERTGQVIKALVQ